MLKFDFEYICPHCDNEFTVKELIKKPFQGTLKSYQFTPAPSIHCPHCEQKLKRIFPIKYALIPLVIVMIIVAYLLINWFFDLAINKWVENILLFILFLIAYWATSRQLEYTYFEIDDD